MKHPLMYDPLMYAIYENNGILLGCFFLLYPSRDPPIRASDPAKDASSSSSFTFFVFNPFRFHPLSLLSLFCLLFHPSILSTAPILLFFIFFLSRTGTSLYRQPPDKTRYMFSFTNSQKACSGEKKRLYAYLTTSLTNSSGSSWMLAVTTVSLPCV